MLDGEAGRGETQPRGSAGKVPRQLVEEGQGARETLQGGQSVPALPSCPHAATPPPKTLPPGGDHATTLPPPSRERTSLLQNIISGLYFLYVDERKLQFAEKKIKFIMF